MGEKIKLVFLGTSDSIPSALRNHPAFLLKYKGENILIDCGEGTQRQFRKARLNPCKVTRILITHRHADHILGLPGLLKTLAMSGYHKTLYIYGPKGIKIYLKSLFKNFQIKNDFPIKIKEVSGRFLEDDDFYLESEKMFHGVPCNAYSFIEKDKRRLDKKKMEKKGISSGPHLKELKEGKDIIHREKKYSFKDLTYLEKGKKFSFVLDTVFNEKIVPFVKGADALICESTFSSELLDKAKEFKHMTLAQTTKIAREAKVEKLFLVHISQRFSKNFKEIHSEAKKDFLQTYLPKDLDVFDF